MRQLLLLILFLLYISSCSEDKEDLYTGKEVTYNLNQVSLDYDHDGKVTFKEMKIGALEITIQLSGEKGEDAYYFPAHLHNGTYDNPDAPMAAMLNPIDIRTLKSVTIINELSSGEVLRFDQLQNFDGHVKVHLAADGPDYKVILVAGNIGSNDNTAIMNIDKIAICEPM